MIIMDQMAAAEARHKRDGFDLQWWPTDDDGSGCWTISGNWNYVLEYQEKQYGDVKMRPRLPVIINNLLLCERPSGANAEANHAAFQKSRDRVAAELAQYDHVLSPDDIRLRPVTTKDEFYHLFGETAEKD